MEDLKRIITLDWEGEILSEVGREAERYGMICVMIVPGKTLSTEDPGSIDIFVFHPKHKSNLSCSTHTIQNQTSSVHEEWQPRVRDQGKPVLV